MHLGIPWFLWFLCPVSVLCPGCVLGCLEWHLPGLGPQHQNTCSTVNRNPCSVNSRHKAFIAVVCKPEKSASECIEKKIIYRQLCLEIGINDCEIFMHRLLDKHFSDPV